jgi:hypothetical protein
MSRPWQGYKPKAPARFSGAPVLFAGPMGRHSDAVPAKVRDPHRRVDSDTRRRKARKVRSIYAGVGADRYAALGAK